MTIEIAERIDDPQEAQRTALEGFQAELHTSMPGLIVSYDPAKQTAVVQPAIKGTHKMPDGSTQFVNLPLLLDVPVHFPSGGGATITFPVKAGDECLVHFGSRDMSAWWQSGGIQAPIESRMHDLSDGFALVGIRSQARTVAGGTHPTNIEIRSDDGAQKISLDPSAGTLTIVTTGNISLTTTGAIDLHSATLKHNGVNVGSTHTHGDPQGGNTTPPNPT